MKSNIYYFTESDESLARALEKRRIYKRKWDKQKTIGGKAKEFAKYHGSNLAYKTGKTLGKAGVAAGLGYGTWRMAKREIKKRLNDD